VVPPGSFASDSNRAAVDKLRSYVSRATGTISLVTTPASPVRSSATANHSRARACVDVHGHDRHAPPQPPERVAVRRVIAVVAPDPAEL